MKKIFTLCVVLCLSYLSMGATNLKHEFRATWLTTAWGNDWPKTQVTSDATRKQQQDELIAIFDRLQAGNMNAVCLQVRGRSDAFYQSSYEPWAAELAGARGTNPGYDPLAFAIEEAHKRGLELHAWVNPFRVTSAGTLDANDLVKKNAGQWIIQYNNGSFTGEIIDPGYPEAREYVLNVLMEIISNYDIDGIVMDDYFYPYGGTTTEDAASKALHKPANVVDVNQNGDTDDDWRRSNVDVFLEELYNQIQATKPWVRFGMGTFGIWTTQTKVAQAYGISLPSGISGLDDYDVQACNPVEWVKNGYVDYINPQLYWPTTSTGQNYGKLCQWWAKDVCEHFSDQLTDGKKVHFFSSQSISSNSAVSEIQAEIDVNRNNLSSGSTGSVFFDTDAYLNMDNALMTSRFATHALPPAMDWKSNTALAAPTNLTVSGSMLTWQHATAERFTVYVYPKGTAWSTAKNDPAYLQGVIYGKSMDISGIDTNANDIAVCAYDRFGVEHTAAVYSNDSGAGTTPNPETIIWELNGGEVNIKTVEVPTNDGLWEALKEYYQTFYSEYRADQPITAVSTFMTKACAIMTNASSEYKWLGDYIMSVAADQGYTLTDDPNADSMEALWRWHVHSFLNCNQRTAWLSSADFSTAGQPSEWGPAYQIAHGAVLLPTYVTSAYTLPTPVHPSGYEFLGWYDNAEFAGSPLTTIPANWTGTLYAQWQENAPTIDPTWQITYTSTDGNIVTPNATDVFGANIVSNTYEEGQGVITFDGPVTSIGEEAFNSRKSLTSITIPNSVTSIGYRAFNSCSGLTSITIPNSVTSIGNYAFNSCSGLTSIVVDGGNTTYDSREKCNAIIETATNTLIKGCQNTIIPNSVTSIGDEAFYGCLGLTSITIPNSVTSIGERAFYSCSGLTSITIPNSVTSIGYRAFSGCSGLTSIIIGNSVTSIGNYAFSKCTSLTSIIIPNSVTSIGNYAFDSCSGLTSIVVDGGNTTYDSREKCNAIIETATNTLIKGCQNTIIPNSVTSIGDEAFSRCLGLTSITIPNSVTSIGDEAFHGCSGLTSITIPKSVTSIGKRAFGYCSSLTSITIGNSVTSIGGSAFQGCSSLTSITIPNSVTSIGDGAFSRCFSFDTIYVEATTPPALEDSTVFMDTPSPVCVIPCGTLAAYEASDWASQVGSFEEDCVEGQQIYYTSTDGNIVTPNKTDVFGANIVSNTYENGVGTITFDGPITIVGDSAFISRSKLSSITIPDGVISIGDFAFRNCSSLQSITIPNSVINIGEDAFWHTGIYDDEANWLNNVLYIDNCLIEAKGLSGTYAILENTRVIAEMACYSLYDLTSITIPNSVTSIGDHAFMHTPIRTVIIPRSLTNIGRVVFTELDTIIVEKGNSRYDSRDNCNAIIETATNTLIAGCEKTIIPNSVTRIGEWAFAFYSLHNLVIPNSITSIGDYAFWRCYYHNYDNNNNIVIPSSVTHIGDKACRWLSDNYTNHIYVKSPTPPTIGKEAFDSSSKCYIPCNSSTAYQRSDWNTYFSEFVEVGCDPNSQITYTSTDGCIVRPYAYNVFGANIVSNTYENGVGTITFDAPITTIGDYAFAYQSSLTSITIPNSVMNIGSYAFHECTSLTFISIPNSVTNIGDNAFCYCSSLTSITIPDSMISIGDWAFYNSQLETIYVDAIIPPTIGVGAVTTSPICYIPCGALAAYAASKWLTEMDELIEEEGCRKCGDNLYWEYIESTHTLIFTGHGNMYDYNSRRPWDKLCDSIQNVSIPEGVTSIGNYAFYLCHNLSSITIPNSVTSIGNYAFYDCESLNLISLGNTLTHIGKSAFYRCAFSSITLPESLTSIGEGAFYMCDSLVTINIPDGITSIENRTFCSCESLASIKIPDNVVSIGEQAFSYCESLTSVNIPNNVTNIGDGAFHRCCTIDSIFVPKSVTQIGESAFCLMRSLISIVVEDGNTTYDSRENCNAIIETETNTLIFGCKKTKIPNTVINIGSHAFESDAGGMSNIIIPSSVQYIGEYAFNCINMWKITVEAIHPPILADNVFAPYHTNYLECIIPCGTLAAYQSSDWANQVGSFVEECVEGQQITYTSTDGNIVTPNKTDVFGANIVSNIYENGVGTITFDGPVTSIGEEAFRQCSSIASITIPKSVTSIGQFAFGFCSSLTSITIPENVTSIVRGTFQGCSSIVSIVVDNNNTMYDSRNDCNAIIETATNVLVTGCKNTIIPNGITTIDRWAFASNKSLASITIPNTVMTIADHAFHSCSSLPFISIPNSVTSIGVQAFYNCSLFSSFTIPESVTTIGKMAFNDCTSLDTIYVEASTPPTLGVDAFTSSPLCNIPCGTIAAYEASDWASQVSEFVEEGCAPIQMCGDDLYWEYADGVLTIIGTGDMYDYADDKTGPAPWYDVRGSITTINMPNEMTKIGDYAFYKCTEVTSINMPTTLTAIGEKAFAQDTKLACDIILPASMTTIASRAFFNCQAVTAFHIEATTPPTIPNDAFERTTAPIHVPCGYGHIYGKHAQWGMLNLEMCELLQDNVYYYPIDGHTARAVTYHSNPTDTIVILSAVVIDGMPRTVTEVAASAFADCKDIPAIIFNEGLEYIGERAFVRCYGLHGTIVLPATLETIGERAFSYCDNVEKYLIQAMTPPALGANAFTGDNKNALFYISCEAMDDYKVATNWSSLKSRLRDACLNIYHYNTALGANGVHTTEDTLVASIYYRRKFTPYRWETLYLPFEVDRVTVLEDGVEYDLTAWDIVYGGHYFLAKPDGMLNKEILFGFTDELESHTPYIIQFSDTYYADKIITFYGKESWNKLSTSFEVLSSSAWMQIAGNTTLQDQLLEKPVYMLRSGLDFILQKTTTTLHPFECYVMPYATPSGTPARMNVRFRGDVPTAVESVKGNESHLTYTVDGYTLTVYPQGQAFSIYSLNGALIYSCEAGKEAVECELNSGCYLLHAGTEAHKIML